MDSWNVLILLYVLYGWFGIYTISGTVCELVTLEASHPKKVGRAFSPRLTNVLVSGIAGKAVPFETLVPKLLS